MILERAQSLIPQLVNQCSVVEGAVELATDVEQEEDHNLASKCK